MFQKILAQTGLHPLQRRLQQEPYYRFRSFEEMQLAASWGLRIEANRASVDDWLRLPGLSIHQARSLTQLTNTGLNFYCIEDVAAALGLPLAQVQPWAAMLQFCYYSSESHLEGGSEGLLEPAAIAINSATAEELMAVPAIDAFLGRAIVHYRRSGPYKDLSDLQQRLRLTTAVTAELLHYLKF
jgi:DNA uptake protein ComE-like DNA-binding protein